MVGKMWQRPLKDGRVETYVAVEGHFLHTWASPLTTNVVLECFAESAGVNLPRQIERKPALFGRRRRSDNQLTIDDALAAA